MMRGSKLVCGSRLGLCALGLLATACPNPNIYGTPRTTPRGKLSHTIAAEGVGYRMTLRDTGTSDSNQPRDLAGTTFVMPSYMLRVGLVDRLDFGFRAANFTSLAVDMKFNFLKSRSIDLAVDPMLQWAAIVVDATHLHLPLLIGINASENFSIVLTPGVTYGTSNLERNTNGETDLTEVEQLMGTTGFSARFGIGFDARISPKFALHPEVTFLKALKTPSDSEIENVLIYVFGVGFNLGAQPDYSDLAETNEAKP